MQKLNEVIQKAGGAVPFLRRAKDPSIAGPAFDPPLIIPQVPYEFTSWQEEMRSWRTGVALFDQSHHMPEFTISGPDAHTLLCSMACNSLVNSKPGRAHQMVCVNPEGHMLGDGILFNFGNEEFLFLGHYVVAEWLKFNARKQNLRVSFSLVERSPTYGNGSESVRRHCRYQLQGPNAGALIEKLNGGPLDEVKFFHMTKLQIGGHAVQALKHGMAGVPGLEIWAPWELRHELRATILEEGREFGTTPVGALAYLAAGMEGGWIHWIVPAVFDVPSMDEFRASLPANDFAGILRLTGSFVSSDVRDYYKTPFDMGYGHIVKFDHDFVGFEALKKLDQEKAQKNVTLVWNSEDAGRLLAEMSNPDGKRVRTLHLPVNGDKLEINYDLLTAQDQAVGHGFYTGYSANERGIFTSGLVDHDIQIGNEVVLHWGDANDADGEVFPIRATVGPTPYSAVARTEYASGWRQKVFA